MSRGSNDVRCRILTLVRMWCVTSVMTHLGTKICLIRVYDFLDIKNDTQSLKIRYKGPWNSKKSGFQKIPFVLEDSHLS